MLLVTSVLVATSSPASALLVPRIPNSPSKGGTQVWVARDTGSKNAYNQIAGMVTSPDGSTVYVGRTSAGRFAVVAHNALTGVSRWSVRTSDPLGLQMFAEAIAISPDGTRLYVTGDVEQSTSTRLGRTVAYDTADGLVVWTTDIAVPAKGEMIPRSIVVSPDGNRVIVTGSRTGRHGANDFWDYYTVAYSVETGSRIWKAIYDGPAHGGDTPEGLGVTPDGSTVFVTGTSKGSRTDNRALATVAYRASDGSLQWTSRFGLGADNFSAGLVVSPNGANVFVAGYGRSNFSAPHRYELVKYRVSTGTALGVATFAGGDDDYASSVAISADGARVFMTGSGAAHALTVAYDASAMVSLWSSRYDGGHGVDSASAVMASPDGRRVYVTGESSRGGIACFGEVPTSAYATVSYTAVSGAPIWVSRYSGLRRDPDQATHIAINPKTLSVYVAGNSDYGCAGSDVATVAYTP